jgi:putative transposase
MPRSARIIVPNVPHHVVQRGHNRSSVFAESADFNYYVQTLREWKITLGIKVYGYCLMTNHVHLILEPSDDAQVIGKLESANPADSRASEEPCRTAHDRNSRS